MQAMTPFTALEPGMEMFEKGTPQSFYSSTLAPRSSLERPVSYISVAYTDIEDEDDSSEFEEYSGSSSDNRRSQTTISTFEEVHTPEIEQRPQFAEWYLPKAVEGPKGPHLFRTSQSSNDFDYALQMSPLLPRETPLRLQTSFREATPATVVPKSEYNNIASAVAHLDNAEVRAWSSRDVATWMYQNGFENEVIDKFAVHDITGAVLLDLQFDDLKELEIESFGKRHQLWNQIDSLRTLDGLVSPIAPAPIPTPFEDLDHPCSAAGNRSKSKNRDRRRRDKPRGAGDYGDDLMTPITPGGGRRRRGRRNKNPADDLITPAESVSIVAIEQLLPKPHTCAKGERCAKYRKQQRQLARLQEEHGFPISPEKGGQIFIAGDPGNARTAYRAVENVHRPTSDAEQSVVVPSVVASSDLLGPSQLPDFNLQEGMLQKLEHRDPQDNVRHFLTLQGVDQPYASATPIEAPPTPPREMFPSRPHLVIPQHQHYPQVSAFSASTSAHTTKSFDPFNVSTPLLHPPEFMPAPHYNLKSLPKLTIPVARSMSAQPYGNPRNAIPANSYVAPDTTFSPCRTASPGGIYRFGTPMSEMDVPVTAVPLPPVSRDTSQSVPPNMQYKVQLQRAGSRQERRRPSLPLPALNEGQVFSPLGPQSDDDTLHGTQFSDDSAKSSPVRVAMPVVAEMAEVPSVPLKGGFSYNGVNHHGWMKKRRTRLLRHEWEDHHFRLQGTTLAMHPNELPTSSALHTIDVDEYAVACSSLASNKLSAKLRALKLSSSHQKEKDSMAASAFEFQLVPAAPTKSDVKRVMPNGKIHHFAVKGRDERIDWMRELMLAKALKAKNDGYEVNVNGADM
ncbi:SAM and PH domain-containing protein [Dothidotthia symphoricarpi CBS 119687]|uniref:SAM and PH domain-containing protein n=1 Tax=Dothidotthia symphoricarpi CBS 119687 TaxID=1392245 RepID=A0A6A6ATW2_9PLEO|nr:SAM and PH domain-containing protein [Dothidotthia symphoricarpi CBS 119687]KAF2134277.1 SAM and PH domain-containing protein [Dothidotthia symphoricarpi CBS 119687]